MIKQLFKHRCYNGGKKHNYKARYTEKSRNMSTGSYTGDLSDLRQLSVVRVYVRDVCEWCGNTVELSAPKETVNLRKIEE